MDTPGSAPAGLVVDCTAFLSHLGLEQYQVRAKWYPHRLAFKAEPPSSIQECLVSNFGSQCPLSTLTKNLSARTLPMMNVRDFGHQKVRFLPRDAPGRGPPRNNLTQLGRNAPIPLHTDDSQTPPGAFERCRGFFESGRRHHSRAVVVTPTVALLAMIKRTDTAGVRHNPQGLPQANIAAEGEGDYQVAAPIDEPLGNEDFSPTQVCVIL